MSVFLADGVEQVFAGFLPGHATITGLEQVEGAVISSSVWSAVNVLAAPVNLQWSLEKTYGKDALHPLLRPLGPCSLPTIAELQSEAKVSEDLDRGYACFEFLSISKAPIELCNLCGRWKVVDALIIKDMPLSREHDPGKAFGNADLSATPLRPLACFCQQRPTQPSCLRFFANSGLMP